MMGKVNGILLDYICLALLAAETECPTELFFFYLRETKPLMP